MVGDLLPWRHEITALSGREIHLRHLLDVGTGSERLLRAGEHHGRYLVVGIECRQRALQLGDHLVVQSVQRLGPIERDQADGIFLLDQYRLVRHPDLPRAVRWSWLIGQASRSYRNRTRPAAPEASGVKHQCAIDRPATSPIHVDASPLTIAAIEPRSTALHDLLDGSATAPTRLALASIDQELCLKIAELAVGGDIVAKRRATRIDRREQGFP